MALDLYWVLIFCIRTSMIFNWFPLIYRVKLSLEGFCLKPNRTNIKTSTE